MTLRSVLSWELMAALSVPLGIVSAAAAGPIAPSTGSLQVSQEPVGCMIADQYPQIEATVAPSSNVASVRVYFRSSLSPDLYYVVAVGKSGRYVANMPRPQLNAGPVAFYVEAAASLAGAAVASAVGGAAAAGGILGMSTAVAVATAAVAVGVGTAVVAQSKPNDNGRFPPGRPCTADPRPGCQPASPSR